MEGEMCELLDYTLDADQKYVLDLEECLTVVGESFSQRRAVTGDNLICGSA